MTQVSARELALDDLIRITEKGAFASAAMAQSYAAHPDLSARDRGLYTALVEGTLERLICLDYFLNRISKTPVRKMKPLIRGLLRMSAYQILFLDRVPDHAAVSEALRIAQQRGFGSLKGFVNGVLRNLARQKDEIALPDRDLDPVRYLSVCFSCPEWIVRLWAGRYGMERTEEMLRTFPAKKEICFWVNPAVRDGQALSEYPFVRPHPDLDGVFLTGDAGRLIGSEAFAAGAFYIQDVSSILAVIPALCALRDRADARHQTAAAPAGAAAASGDVASSDAASSLTILDVCGAPGGKSLYLASHLPHARVICRDLSREKVQKISENIRRLHLANVEAQVQDACVLREEDIDTADLVIADLPCSGLGVIARKADMRYRVQEDDIVQLAALQRQILDVVWRYVKPGGLLLYSTCTISEEENEDQARWIPENLPFAPVPLRGLPERFGGTAAEEGCLQILPGTDPYQDGFFLSMFERI